MDKRIKNWLLASVMAITFTALVSLEAGMINFFGFIILFEVLQTNNYIESGYA